MSTEEKGSNAAAGPPATLSAEAIAKMTKAERTAYYAQVNKGRAKEKKPKLSKKERRELQEKQRAAKGQTTDGGGSAKGQPPPAKPGGRGAAAPPSLAPVKAGPAGPAGSATPITPSPAFRATHLFSHLPAHEHLSSRSMGLNFSKTSEVHPAVLALGLKYAAGEITGTDARTVSMLQALRRLVEDYTAPANQAMERHLLKSIDAAFGFLTRCRPHTTSMGNAMRYLKRFIGALPEHVELTTEVQRRDAVVEAIDCFLQERIVMPAEYIARVASKRIGDGDVVLTFGHSHCVEMLLRRASESGTHFRLVVVDARPLHEGRSLLRSLSGHCPDLPITYTCFNGLSYALGEVNKVVLGADGLTSNGAVIGRVGTAAVAMAANSRHIPVIIACETYKLCRRVQLDAIVANEMGNPDDLLVGKQQPQSAAERPSLSGMMRQTTGGEGQRHYGKGEGDGNISATEGVDRLNLMFDLTPIKFISLVITEAGPVPPTSAPVLLREYGDDIM